VQSQLSDKRFVIVSCLLGTMLILCRSQFQEDPQQQTTRQVRLFHYVAPLSLQIKWQVADEVRLPQRTVTSKAQQRLTDRNAVPVHLEAVRGSHSQPHTLPQHGT